MKWIPGIFHRSQPVSIRSYKFFSTYDVISAIGQAKTLAALGMVVGRLIEPDGPRRYWIGIVPNQLVPPDQQPDMILASRWLEEWPGRYFSRGYAEIDPVVCHVRKENGPVSWRELQAVDGRASVVMDEAADFGLRAGLSIPQSTMDNIRIGISFAGLELDDDPRARVAMSVIAATAAARSIEINQASRALPIPSLSPREMDCLLWLIEGKTDWEIGSILGISRSAVVKHMDSMRAKLGVVTRIQVCFVGQPTNHLGKGGP